MPTSAQYARYRADRTTIWVSKTAAALLARERTHVQESVGVVLDRLLKELKRFRGGAKKTPTVAARKAVVAKKKPAVAAKKKKPAVAAKRAARSGRRTR